MPNFVEKLSDKGNEQRPDPVFLLVYRGKRTENDGFGGPLGYTVDPSEAFRTVSNPNSAKFRKSGFHEVHSESRCEGPLFSPSSPRPSLSLSQSSYFWPSGMVAPWREPACRSNFSLVMPWTSLR